MFYKALFMLFKIIRIFLVGNIMNVFFKILSPEVKCFSSIFIVEMNKYKRVVSKKNVESIGWSYIRILELTRLLGYKNNLVQNKRICRFEVFVHGFEKICSRKFLEDTISFIQLLAYHKIGHEKSRFLVGKMDIDSLIRLKKNKIYRRLLVFKVELLKRFKKITKSYVFYKNKKTDGLLLGDIIKFIYGVCMLDPSICEKSVWFRSHVMGLHNNDKTIFLRVFSLNEKLKGKLGYLQRIIDKF